MAKTGAIRSSDEHSRAERTIRADIRFEVPDADCPIARASDRNISTHMILENRCYVVSEADGDDGAVQQHEQAVSGCCPCTVFCRYGCLPEFESASNGRVTVTTYLTDRETVQDLIRDLQEVSEYVSLQRLVDLDEERFADLRSVDVSLLSDAQEAALSRAIDAGYYDNPRRIDFDALAEELEITKPTLSKRLRIAESKLLVDLVEE
ncbi:helix-turn-helix domain-containing protein [Natronoarchaeum sp. GCM10025703]|uniref:helix-turn-helix domain-containing protein n=1 Tax=unclassified Natronoarchaeum TaxID=2620183 RepID=UPI0036165C5A